MAKYVTVIGYCSTTKRLLGLQCENKNGDFVAVGSFSASSTGEGYENEKLNGRIYAGNNFSCKYCGNNSLVICYCGAVICVNHGANHVTCPKCGKGFGLKTVSIEELEKTDLKSDKQ